MAAAENHSKIVDYLISHKADVDGNHVISNRLRFVKTDGNGNPLVKYDKNGNGYVEFNYYQNSYNKSYHSPLISAAAAGHADMVDYLLEKYKIYPHATDRKGRNALYYAVKENKPSLIGVIKSLLKKKVSPNQGRDTVFEQSTLHHAVQNTSVEVCKLLVEARAHLNARDDYGDTPLHSAARRIRINRHRKNSNFYQSLAICKYLIQSGANVHAENKQKKTPNKVLDLCGIDIVSLIPKAKKLQAADSPKAQEAKEQDAGDNNEIDADVRNAQKNNEICYV